MEPYYSDSSVTLYLGDMREVLPVLDVAPDCVIADPPYEETTLEWDRWPDGWPAVVAKATSSMWCFGSMRMFLDRRDEFDDWRLSQDVVWEKQNGSGFSADRFKRVHEHAVHWFRGNWWHAYHEVPRHPAEFDAKGRTASAGRNDRAAHAGSIAAATYVDDGTRLARSVLKVRNMNGLKPIHRTEKPVALLLPLIEYACPPGGTVLDPFAGSGSTASAARMAGLGIKTVLIEGHEPACEAIANRLQQDVLPLTEGTA